MKKTASFLLVIMMSQLLSAQKLVTYYYDWNKVHPSEQFYVNSAGQKSGSYKQYDQSGVVLKEYNYLNGAENGLCIDYAIGPENKRVVQAKSNFINGQPEGYFVEYCRYSGYTNKIQEGQNKNGKKTGLWKVWWCDDDTRGVLKEVGSYVSDNQSGEWKSYSRKGILISKGIYTGGMKNGTWSYYNEGGNLISKGDYKNDKEDGMWSFYDPSDSTRVLNTGKYEAGYKVGKWKIYFDEKWNEVSDPQSASFYREVTLGVDGKPTDELVKDHFITGEVQWDGYLLSMNPDVFNKKGASHYYYKSGGIQKIVDYDKGKQTGYYENGKLESEKIFSSNMGYTYFESGKIKRNETYKNGEVVNYVEFDETGEIIEARCPDTRYQGFTWVITKDDIQRSRINSMLHFLNYYKDDNSKFSFDVCETQSDGFSYLISSIEGSELYDNAPLNKIIATNITEIKRIVSLYKQSDNLKNIEVANQIRKALEKIMP